MGSSPRILFNLLVIFSVLGHSAFAGNNKKLTRNNNNQCLEYKFFKEIKNVFYTSDGNNFCVKNFGIKMDYYVEV